MHPETISALPAPMYTTTTCFHSTLDWVNNMSMQNQFRNVPTIGRVRIIALLAVILVSLVVTAYYAVHGIIQSSSYQIAVAVIALSAVGLWRIARGGPQS